MNLKKAFQDIKDYGKFTFYTENLDSYEPAWDYELLRSIAKAGNEEIVKTLLQPLSDAQVLQLINLTDSDKHNILHFAVLGGAEIVKLFLNKINPESHAEIITDTKYGNILHFAASNSTAEVVEVLLNAISTPLTKEQSYNVLYTLNIDTINSLLSNQNFDSNAINHVDSNNKNILHHMLLGNHKGK
ncbi:ankyrin repeat domain-containing protein [Rickettsia tamurae]|uniref:ankyrin repeat domain-containing protein n=1 Tax=Rickettsia tamurae TaxID=334545 RepID=UPI00050A13F1|nr:ankyrin repeat domain-containing protein [Rickettsia tamurae]